MRKGFTLVEIAITLFIGAALFLGVYGTWNRISVSNKCLANGYVMATSHRYSKFCTKVENGNTIVVHVDSLR